MVTPLSPKHVEALGGRYELLGLVGSGGMGVVYRARDRQLDEIVALKVLRHDLALDPLALARFRREVKLARRVTHRNVARTFDIGEHAGIVFLTMELLEGESLAQRLARKGPLSIDAVIEIGVAIAEGLEAAHLAGVVHRDLKPENVLLSNDGRIVVTDFGVASADDARVEHGRRIVGTPAYMAPEQLEAPETIDFRTDLYALGLVLYELLTGALPWSAKTEIGLAMARLFQPPRDPRELRLGLDPELATTVVQLLAKSPDDRPGSASAIAEALRRLALGAARTIDAHPSDGFSLVPRAIESDVAVARIAYEGQPGDDYLADGLGYALVGALQTLHVNARAGAADSPKRDAADVGRELGVDAVVIGSLAVDGDALAVSIQLVTVADGFVLWTDRFTRMRGDVMAIAAEAAAHVVSALGGRHPSNPTEALPPHAADLYLRGRRVYHRFWRNAEAVTLFEQALALAPNDPRILAALSLALSREVGLDVDTAAARAAARRHADRSVVLAPDLADAHVAMGVAAVRDGDVAAGATEIRIALDRSPQNVDALEQAARILLETRHLEEGIAHAEVAMRVEPLLELTLPFHVIRARALLGEWDVVDAMLATPPAERAAGPTYWLSRARLAVWRRDRAIHERLIEELEANPISDSGYPLALARLARDGVLGVFERKFLEDRATSRTSSARQRSFFQQILAEIFARVGETERALGTIEQAVTEGLFDEAWLDGCSALVDIRTSPRFDAARRVVASRADAASRALLTRDARE